jgi:hypothetical protein
MKKLVLICSVLLIVILTLGLMASCSKSPTTNTTTSSTTNTSVVNTSTSQQTTTASSTGTATTTNPLVITHTLVGRPNCLSCHAPGSAAITVMHSIPVPADHTAYTNADCMKSGCHFAQ